MLFSRAWPGISRSRGSALRWITLVEWARCRRCGDLCQQDDACPEGLTGWCGGDENQVWTLPLRHAEVGGDGGGLPVAIIGVVLLSKKDLK